MIEAVGVKPCRRCGTMEMTSGRCPNCMLKEPELIAIDPGPEESGWVRFMPNYELLRGRGYIVGFQHEPPGRLIECAIEPNERIRARLMGAVPEFDINCDLAIEVITPYGKPVGGETFKTCEWIGVFCDRFKGRRQHRLSRPEINKWLLHSTSVKDTEIRRALCDMWGGEKVAKGNKTAPGLLYAMSKHMWPALACAIAAAMRIEGENRKAELEEVTLRRRKIAAATHRSGDPDAEEEAEDEP